jgi:hypothetical protein
LHEPIQFYKRHFEASPNTIKQDPGASAADSEARHWGLFARLFIVFFLAIKQLLFCKFRFLFWGCGVSTPS